MIWRERRAVVVVVAGQHDEVVHRAGRELAVEEDLDVADAGGDRRRRRRRSGRCTAAAGRRTAVVRGDEPSSAGHGVGAGERGSGGGGRGADGGARGGGWSWSGRRGARWSWWSVDVWGRRCCWRPRSRCRPRPAGPGARRRWRWCGDGGRPSAAARCWASVALGGAALALALALRVRHDRARYPSALNWSARVLRIASSPVALVVQKFGGTSVADPDRMRAVADHIARTKRRGNEVVVVISAMGKETDELLRLAARGQRHPARPRDGHAHHRRRAQGHRPAVHGPARHGGRRRVVHGQPGRLHHRHHPHQRQDPRGPGRPHPRRARRGHVPVVGGSQGVSDRPRRHLPRSGRLRHHRGRAGPRPRRRRLRALHRRVRACSRPIRGWCPTPARWSGSASTSCSR